MKRIGITMGCPVGIGPEIILKYFQSFDKNSEFSPIVIGDVGVLRHSADHLGIELDYVEWSPGDEMPKQQIPVFAVSQLDPTLLAWGKPNRMTGMAMAAYIETAVQLVHQNVVQAITTCPISKYALQLAGFTYPGHTEMLASLTSCENFSMMIAGEKLRVTLVTIHCSFTEITQQPSVQRVHKQIGITNISLIEDFAISTPRIAVAGLNPHGGESGILGNEEETIISPAIEQARQEGIDALGPFPPDTVFYQAVQGNYDAVVCMYHDQGLIPFKLIHFHDGVNVTIGLPLVRTSVDHGTAYDIAGRGIANFESLAAAVKLANQIATNRGERYPQPFHP